MSIKQEDVVPLRGFVVGFVGFLIAYGVYAAGYGEALIILFGAFVAGMLLMMLTIMGEQ